MFNSPTWCGRLDHERDGYCCSCLDDPVQEAVLPVGWYTLADGRKFYGMNEFELKAAAREGWRLQQIADFSLSLRLQAFCPTASHPPAPAKPVLQAVEQLALAI